VNASTSASGDIAVGSVNALRAVVTFVSAGAITDTNGATANVVADSLSATSATGIDLDTTIATATLLSVDGYGAIAVDDTAGGLTVTSATTNNGSIALTAAGGNLTLASVTAGSMQSVSATTTASGNIAVGLVTATGAAVTFVSAGAITDTNGATANVVADSLSDVGHRDRPRHDDRDGDAAVGHGYGAIAVDDTAGGLTVTSATTNNGSITLTAAGGT
jgi:hypothetical protein